MAAKGNIRGVKAAAGARGFKAVRTKWVAPSTGGYSAQSVPGKFIVRPAKPPSNRASVSQPHRATKESGR